MNKKIQPYQFNFIRKQGHILLQAHLSVNDKQTIKTLQAIVLEKINNQFVENNAEIQPLLDGFLEAATSKPRLEQFLEVLKEEVIPFDPPSKQQLTKLFKKTKKLKIPDWDTMDLRDYTFYSWNDSGKQQKFIIASIDGQLVGVQGTISPTTQKGICPLCHETSEVSLFMSKVKESGDGLYTKRGNYICYDSDKCNHNIERTDELNDFIQNVKYTK
ncbi:FusB/FusC family EF-G-binding protein [Enterococcus sp. 5H]|uniref:FusB/FusC family EF-G-binding protein n=1 Tax=Enterococcus sp. 5H TaxID=1229490 RepID=UPI002302A0ED|nr:FusB/FusC family EF-G-binding protein [Enterococcus sp. 5H]MDA9471189.1 fibronectin-binding protein [Enterococcus sp. 5H]